MSKNLLICGKTSCFVLGKNQLSIHINIKDAITALNQSRLDAKLFRYVGRQTSGLWQIVSRRAVSN